MTTRRDILKAAPAVAIAAAAPVAALAVGETEIERLFRQWDAHAYRAGEGEIDIESIWKRV